MREVKVVLDARNRELVYVHKEENLQVMIDKLTKQGKKPVRVITKTIK